jgi:hypothetical protein
MVKKQNSDTACPCNSTNINPSPQQLQSLGKPPTRKIVKHGLALAVIAALVLKMIFF